MKSEIKCDYYAHDAVGDLAGLLQVLNFYKVVNSDFMCHAFHPLAVRENQLYLDTKPNYIKSLHPLVASVIMKMTTAENIAGSGLSFGHHLKINERNGEV